ncbi:hypothetical protein E7Y31_22695 [Candidatus Frankia alpina]|uniref:Uncharacterized protein n=1 Tax=Candidatus Frankia alpina TaxID=2699483 RepID=A0A4S5BD08_9ACTN|nr:hypothetical protein E7Y31_22695 [Candidatus Frankia alpina]
MAQQRAVRLVQARQAHDDGLAGGEPVEQHRAGVRQARRDRLGVEQAGLHRGRERPPLAVPQRGPAYRHFQRQTQH